MSLNKEFEKQGVTLFKYRGTIPIIILIIALALHAWRNYKGISTIDFFETFYYELICLAVSLLGLYIRIHTLGFAQKNTSGRNTNKQIADYVNTTGCYSIMRHPLYVGNFLMWLGIGMLTGSIWFNIIFILSFWLYYERIMYAEESFLIGIFGEEYTNWSNRVPPFFPKLALWQKSDLGFSWVKIIRQEKSGIAALFIVFMLFHQISFFAKNNEVDLTPSFWNVACIAAVIYIATIKTIQKTTSLLDGDRRKTS